MIFFKNKKLLKAASWEPKPWVEHIPKLPEALEAPRKQQHAEKNTQERESLPAYVNKLLIAGANPNKKDGNNKAALHLAIEKGYTDIALILIAHPKTDVNLTRNFGTTALHDAAARGQSQVVKALLARGAKVTTYTSTQNAWEFGLSKQTPKEKIGFFQHTALHLAATNGNPNSIKALLKAGAADDLELTDECGRTALARACMRGREKAAELLINAGANINALDNEGKTPLALTPDKFKDKITPLLAPSPPELNHSASWTISSRSSERSRERSRSRSRSR